MAALIGGTFGAAFVLADAHTALGDQAAAVFRILAAVGLVAVYVAAGRASRHSRSRGDRASPPSGSANLFGRGHWLIVAGELVLLGIGLWGLRALGAPQQANVAWIVLIVGLHFFAFRIAGVWEHGVTVPATLLVVFGLAGLGLAASSDPEWTSFVSGVLSGFTLLSGSIYALSRELRGGRAGGRGASRDPARPTPRTDGGGAAREHRSVPCRATPCGILAAPTRSRTTCGRRMSRER
jgi:hypothetical protein